MLILFLQIALILVTCRLFGYLGRRAGQAQAICDMVAGLALGPSLLGVLAPGVQDWLFPQQITVLAGGVVPEAAEASAAAMARSHAGSSRRTPPEDAPNSSERPNGMAAPRSRTAATSWNRRGSRPVA